MTLELFFADVVSPSSNASTPHVDVKRFIARATEPVIPASTEDKVTFA